MRINSKQAEAQKADMEKAAKVFTERTDAWIIGEVLEELQKNEGMAARALPNPLLPPGGVLWVD